MKNSIFNPKIIVIVTSIMVIFLLIFLSTDQSYEIKEVNKTVNLLKK